MPASLSHGKQVIIFNYSRGGVEIPIVISLRALLIMSRPTIVSSDKNLKVQLKRVTKIEAIE